MNVEINYFVNKNSPQFPCGASTTHMGETYYGCGKTWKEAKEGVLTNLKQALGLLSDIPKKEVITLAETEDELPDDEGAVTEAARIAVEKIMQSTKGGA